MNSICEKIRALLFENRDEEYKRFNASLIPTVESDRVIGVRMPVIRKIAKQLFSEGGFESFLLSLPHEYHEENLLHACLVEQIKDFDLCLKETERFLLFVDNWAVCDCFSPRCFGKNKERLLEKLRLWLSCNLTYTVRFAMNMLMKHFLDADFKEEYLYLVGDVESEEYYVRMMQAWFFATALAKQYSRTLPFIEQKRLSPWVHNKTIQKARESFRLSREQKEYLKTLKI